MEIHSSPFPTLSSKRLVTSWWIKTMWHHIIAFFVCWCVLTSLWCGDEFMGMARGQIQYRCRWVMIIIISRGMEHIHSVVREKNRPPLLHYSLKSCPVNWTSRSTYSISRAAPSCLPSLASHPSKKNWKGLNSHYNCFSVWCTQLINWGGGTL